jgi:hypothetical protein
MDQPGIIPQLGARLGPKLLVIAVALCSLLAGSCKSGASGGSQATVVPERAKVFNSTAQVSHVVGELKSGDQVLVVSKSEDQGKIWVEVKAADGLTGWMDSRYLVNQDVVNQSQKLGESLKGVPVQATGRSKASLKLRLTPDRANEDNVAMLLPSGTPVEIVARERRPRPALPSDNKESDDASTQKFDDWYEVRLKDNQVLPAGWIYAGSVELDIPPEIVYYVSVARRIVGWQNLGSSHDNEGHAGDHFLVLERRVDASNDNVDFDRVKILAYSPGSRDYYTPFREDLKGRFPVAATINGQHGVLKINTIDKDGNSKLLEYAIELPTQGKVSVKKLTLTSTEPAKPRRRH